VSISVPAGIAAAHADLSSVAASSGADHSKYATPAFARLDPGAAVLDALAQEHDRPCPRSTRPRGPGPGRHRGPECLYQPVIGLGEGLIDHAQVERETVGRLLTRRSQAVDRSRPPADSTRTVRPSDAVGPAKGRAVQDLDLFGPLLAGVVAIWAVYRIRWGLDRPPRPRWTMTGSSSPAVLPCCLELSPALRGTRGARRPAVRTPRQTPVAARPGRVPISAAIRPTRSPRLSRLGATGVANRGGAENVRRRGQVRRQAPGPVGRPAVVTPRRGPGRPVPAT
jgi:hypothetical protein